MKKSTLTRFDNENIVFVEIENQEGTAKIIDEVNNTVIDIGGGGGGIDNPTLTLSIDASGVSGELGTIDYLTITENNTVKNKTGIMISGGDNYEFEILVPAWDNGDDPDVFVWTNSSANGGLVGTAYVITATDTENCMANIDQNGGSMYIMVTDPTQPASATLTISNS